MNILKVQEREKNIGTKVVFKPNYFFMESILGFVSNFALSNRVWRITLKLIIH